MRELHRNGAPDAAEQRRKPMGAQARCAFALLLLARAPGALQPDEQADRQSDEESLDQFGRAHFIHAAKAFSALKTRRAFTGQRNSRRSAATLQTCDTPKP